MSDSTSGTVCRHCGEEIERGKKGAWLHSKTQAGYCAPVTVAEAAPAEQPHPLAGVFAWNEGREAQALAHSAYIGAVEPILELNPMSASPAEGPRNIELGQALGKVLVKASVINNVALTGPELLLAAETYCAAQPSAKVEEIAEKIVQFLKKPHSKISDTYEYMQAEIAAILRPYFTADASQIISLEQYNKLLKWFKLFYGFFQDGVKGRPSACASALSEDAELQKFVKEAYEKYSK